MQAFLTKCCANLAPYGCHISEEVYRSDGSKRQHTQQSRATHFLDWAKRMDLDQDPCPPHQATVSKKWEISKKWGKVVPYLCLQNKQVKKRSVAK